MIRRTPYPLQLNKPLAQKRAFLPRFIGWIGYVFSAAVLFAQLGEFFWPADLLANLPLQFLLSSLPLVILLLVFRRWVIASIVMLLGLYQLVPLLAVWGDGGVATPSGGDALTLVQHNIGNFNADRAGLVNSLITESRDADIIVLFEVAPRWTWFLRPLEMLYPNRLVSPQLRSFGFAAFGRKDITVEKKVLYSGFEIAVIRGYTKKNHTPFVVYAAHTPSPYNVGRWSDRNAMLEELAHTIREDKTPNKILVGDLNITPYSPWFETLQRDGGLVLPKQSMKQLGTWPDWMPSEYLRIPLDHRLATPGTVIEATPLSGYGSDHIMLRSVYHFTQASSTH